MFSNKPSYLLAHKHKLNWILTSFLKNASHFCTLGGQTWHYVWSRGVKRGGYERSEPDNSIFEKQTSWFCQVLLFSFWLAYTHVRAHAPVGYKKCHGGFWGPSPAMFSLTRQPNFPTQFSCSILKFCRYEILDTRWLVQLFLCKEYIDTQSNMCYTSVEKIKFMIKRWYFCDTCFFVHSLTKNPKKNAILFKIKREKKYKHQDIHRLISWRRKNYQNNFPIIVCFITASVIGQ